MNTPSVMNVLSSQIKDKRTRSALRKTSKGFKNRISKESTQFKLKKKLTNNEILQMLSNANVNVNGVFNLMERLPMYKYTGTDPRNWNNVLDIENSGIWTKKQWVVYHALGLYKKYKNTGNKNINRYFEINKGLRFFEQSQEKRNQIQQKIRNLKEKNKLTLMDFVQLMNMFKKSEMMSIGY